jgi:hypothetical protein
VHTGATSLLERDHELAALAAAAAETRAGDAPPSGSGRLAPPDPPALEALRQTGGGPVGKPVPAPCGGPVGNPPAPPPPCGGADDEQKPSGAQPR